MDPISVLTPGAQSLVTAILSDTWASARNALAARWARRGPQDPTEADVAQAESDLEAAKAQALTIADQSPAASPAAREALMRAYLTGYLAAQQQARPELAELVRTLSTTVAELAALKQNPTSHAEFKTVSGSVRGNVVQAGDIQGNVSF